MAQSWRINQPKLVIVEGRDEVRVFNSLLSNHLHISNIQVQDYEGYYQLPEFLRSLVRMTNFGVVRSLAVVADADTNRTGRDQSIRDHLANVGLPVPASPLTVASRDGLNVAYLIVPHNTPGMMLEDVCLESVSTDPAMTCIDDYYSCVTNSGLPGPRNLAMSKARVHAFLASREEPDLRLGEAAQKGIWQFSHGAFDPMKDLLQLI